MHAVDFLKNPPAGGVPAVVAVHGDQRLLKRRCVAAVAAAVLGEEDEPTRFAGESVDLAAVLDELATVSMFASARLVVVEDADPFVTRHRAGLEKFVADSAKKKAGGGTLVLDVGKLPKNTKLYKAVAKHGLELDCKPLSATEAAAWLSAAAKREHGKTLARPAAALAVELAGTDLGLLDQELGKLAAFVGAESKITEEHVAALVGGWKAKSTFEMLAAVRRGELDGALAELHKLLLAGEAPLRILGGLNFSLRRLADAVDRTAGGAKLPAALAAAGVFPRERGESEAYLRRLGRPRAAKIRDLLLAADGALRGGEKLSDRTVLERLLVELAP